jgi:Tfp pilus assembly protein PilO
MTTSHKWMAGALALAVAVAAAGWFLLVSPKRGEAADLNAQAESQNSGNSSLETDLALLKQQKKDLPEQQARLAELRTKVPQVEGMPSLIRELNAAAAKAGVDLQSMAPSPAVPVSVGDDPEAAAPVEIVDGVLPPEQLAAINTEIVVVGSYFEIERFVNAVENLDRYVLVPNLTVTEIDSAGADASGSSDTAEGDLTANVSGRVFLLPSVPEVDTTDPAAAAVPEAQ